MVICPVTIDCGQSETRIIEPVGVQGAGPVVVELLRDFLALVPNVQELLLDNGRLFLRPLSTLCTWLEIDVATISHLY